MGFDIGRLAGIEARSLVHRLDERHLGGPTGEADTRRTAILVRPRHANDGTYGVLVRKRMIETLEDDAPYALSPGVAVRTFIKAVAASVWGKETSMLR